MVVVLPSVFLYNLLCAISPCDFVQTPPDSRISRSYFTRDGGRLENEYPVVVTKSGALQGYSMGTLQERHVYAFEGIKYGEAPINSNRFRDPIPAKSWKGVRPAHKTGPACLQMHPLFIRRVIGSEDCLYLNIYAPAPPVGVKTFPSETKLKVLIFIHGGSFLFGEAAEYGPAYIVDRNILVVGMNYRLGPLGFMSTGDSASPGNYGLKDQTLAMKWVHENIEAFGGDPEQVTIMGQSAGSVSVHLHMLSQKSRQYFQAGISLSGTAFNNWGLQTREEGLRWTKRLAKAAKCPIGDSHELVRCLKRRNPAFLVGHQLRIFNWIVFPPTLFAPVIEQESPNAFISSSAHELYERDEVAKYPWICTQTTEEGHLIIYVLLLFQQLGTFRRKFSEFLPVVMDYEHLVRNTTEINDKIQKFYLGDESPLTVPASTIAKIGTDRYFTQGITKALHSHSQIAPTYSYLFSFKGKYNIGKSLFGRWDDELGISHQEDAFYFFNSSRYYDGFKKSDQEYELTQILTNLISNFALKREPLYTNQDGEDLKIWSPVTPDHVQYLEISNSRNIQMIENPFEERIKFWESLNLSDTTPFLPRRRKSRKFQHLVLY